MFSAVEKMVAWRYLRARRKEGFISVIAGFSFLGIMLGVATLIIVMSVMNGFRYDLTSRILGLNGHINVYSVEGPVFEYEPLRDTLEKYDGVKLVMPGVEGQALLSINGAAAGVVVRGLSVEDFKTKPILSAAVISETPDGFGETRVAIGDTLSRKFGLSIGDQLTLISPESKASPFGSIPRSRSYTVGAIFDVGMHEYDSAFIYMPLESAQAFFKLGPGVSTLDVFTDNPARIDALKAEIENNLSAQYAVYDWRDTNASFFNALQVERNVMFLILTLIILVAAFNIISSLIMLVKDKGASIAILRTMGASKGSIMRIFFLTGASIGIVGTAAGAILGISFAKNIETIRQWIEGMTGADLFAEEIYFLSQLPALIEWGEVVAVICMALGLSFLASIYPAWKASKLHPVEALRYE